MLLKTHTSQTFSEQYWAQASPTTTPLITKALLNICSCSLCQLTACYVCHFDPQSHYKADQDIRLNMRSHIVEQSSITFNEVELPCQSGLSPEAMS